MSVNQQTTETLMSDVLLISLICIVTLFTLDALTTNESSKTQTDAANVAMVEVAKTNDDPVVQARAVIAKDDLVKAQEARLKKEVDIKFRAENPEIVQAEKDEIVNSFLKLGGISLAFIISMFAMQFALNKSRS